MRWNNGWPKTDFLLGQDWKWDRKKVEYPSTGPGSTKNVMLELERERILVKVKNPRPVNVKLSCTKELIVSNDRKFWKAE